MRYVNHNSQTVYEREGGIESAEIVRDKSIARYRNRVYVSGPMLEVEAYPIFISKKAAGRAKKAERTNKAMQNVNDRNARMQLNRLIAENFVEWTDYKVGLDYRVQPSTPQEAQRYLTDLLTILRREFRKRGQELKYVYIPIWLTETGRVPKRYHHHLVINAGMDWKEIAKLWPHGRAHIEPLQADADGLMKLSRYLHMHLHGGKRWVASRNLVRPEPEYPKKTISKRQAGKLAMNYELAREHFEKAYPDHVLCTMEVRTNEFVPGIYLYVRMRRRDAWNHWPPDEGGE